MHYSQKQIEEMLPERERRIPVTIPDSNLEFIHVNDDTNSPAIQVQC